MNKLEGVHWGWIAIIKFTMQSTKHADQDAIYSIDVGDTTSNIYTSPSHDT